MTGTLFPCAAGMGALQDGGRSAGRPLCIRRRRKEVEMEQSINVLLVEPGKIPCLRETANSMEAVEEVLGGVSQLGCFLPKRVLLVSRQCQEGLAPNRCLPDSRMIINGPFLLCGLPEAGDCFGSLTPGQQEEFTAVFGKPGEFLAVGDAVYADPDDAADAVYGLWDSMRDGETLTLTKWGCRERSAASHDEK